MPARTFLTISALLLGQLVGCSRTEERQVVAKVDTREITLEDLRRFQEQIAASLPVEEREMGEDAARAYLQDLIDRELMLLEARAQGFDQLPEFLWKWEKEKRSKVVQHYAATRIVPEIGLTMKEIEQRFADSKWSRMLMFAHIRTETEEEAHDILQELKQGKSFEKMARDRSIDQDTAPTGGWLKAWFGRSDLHGMPEAVAEELFELEVETISGPYRLGDGYEVFKILNEIAAPESYSLAFMQSQYWEEFGTRWRELVDELKIERDVSWNQEAISLLTRKAPRTRLGAVELLPAEEEMVLCRFEGGKVTLRDFVDYFNAVRVFHPITFNPAGIVEFANWKLLPEALIYHVALEEGIEQEPSVARWLTLKTDMMLLEELRLREIVERAEVDSAAARAFYEKNLKLFMQLGEIYLLEILVESREQAEGLLQRIRDGEDMEALAAQFTRREDTEGGRFHMHDHPSERRVYEALYDSVIAAKVGELHGPVGLHDGFSIFRILETVEPRPQEFETVASRAKWWAKKEEERRLFDALLAGLRAKYASKVIRFEERLEMLK